MKRRGPTDNSREFGRFGLSIVSSRRCAPHKQRVSPSKNDCCMRSRPGTGLDASSGLAAVFPRASDLQRSLARPAAEAEFAIAPAARGFLALNCLSAGEGNFDFAGQPAAACNYIIGACNYIYSRRIEVRRGDPAPRIALRICEPCMMHRNVLRLGRINGAIGEYGP
jgi:hypothetical protein